MKGTEIMKKTVFINCMEEITANRKRRKARKLLKAGLKESAQQAQAATAAPVCTTTKPYILPPVEGNMTYHLSWGTRNTTEEANVIISVLNAFRLRSTITKINQGPRLTQYVIEPAPGTQVQAILRREKEFQAALHCNASLRFDNGYVYIEVPTGTETVFLGDMLIDNNFKSSNGFTMAIGMGVDGSKHYIDIEKAYHILISGMTGSGKSIVLHNLILSLLMKKNAAQMHLYIIDPKATEFEYYKNLAACTVVSEVNGAVELLKNLCIEMDRRYSVLASAGCRDIDSYNAKFADAPMRRDIVFIDELSDLMSMGGKSVEGHIVRIAQKARACGIHLVIATQYPVAKVVTGLIKANMPTKICLRVGTVTNSMVALDMTGGEKLLGNGDMLFLPNGAITPIRLQGGYVSEKAINNVVFELMKNQ